MGYYQNIYTQVQVHPLHPEAGVEIPKIENRAGKGGFSYLAGLVGNAQIGPIYLGSLGTMSLACGFIAIEIMQSAVPNACEFDDATDAELIADCNPWANRAGDPEPGDFLILWDQQGGHEGRDMNSAT